MSCAASIGRTDIAQVVEAIGLSGRAVCLHASLASFGHVRGGAATVLGGFVDCSCTVVVPAFHYSGIVRTPLAARWLRNGCDEATLPEPGAAGVVPYRNEPGCIVRDMGAIPAALLRDPASARGHHPVNSLAALGARAAELVRGQSPLDVYAPYRRLFADGDAWLVLAGVGLTKATPVHFAEALAGRALFRIWAAAAGQGECECTVGGCSEGFEKLAPVVRSIEREATVGASRWRIFPLSPFLEMVADAIRADPSITACASQRCLRCPDAVAGGPIHP